MTASTTTDLKARAGGLVLALIGGYLLKSSFLDVLRQAESSAPEVTTSMKALIVAPMFVLLGLFLMTIGAPGDGSSGMGRHVIRASDRRLKPLGWIIVGAVLVPGLVLYLWLKNHLASLGYDG
jgi:hypothetical protein